MITDVDCSTVRELAAEYVLGTLDPATEAAVRDHLRTCSDAHAEVRELAGTLPSLARSLDPVAPRDELRVRLLAAARESRPVSLVAPTRAADEPGPRGRPEASWLARLATPRLAWSFSAVAAAIALVAVVSTLALRTQLEQSTRTADTLRTIVTEASRAGTRIARLEGTDHAPGVSGLAAVAADGGALVLEGLPPAPPDAYYEAWYLSGGAARSAGHVELMSDGTGVLAGLSAGSAFDQMAVTLEPVGGGSGPDGPIFAAGSVTTNPG